MFFQSKDIQPTAQTPPDPPSQQLLDELRKSQAKGLASRRPILTHLNADTTWLVSIPTSPAPLHPPLDAAEKSPHSASKDNPLKTKTYTHILIDPWLRGYQSDVAAFFSTQSHATPSAFQTVAEIEDAIRRIENTAKGEEANLNGDGEVMDTSGKSPIDAVVVSHEFTDHMHKQTLLEINKIVPVYATAKAACIINCWKHFDSVIEISSFHEPSNSSAGTGLPSDLDISRLAYAGSDLLYYHSAIMLSFQSIAINPPNRLGKFVETEAIIYTPHGISPTDLAPVADAVPAIKVLALLHGLQDIRLGAQLNMGAHNGLKIMRLLDARYWVGTHDELKKGSGIVSWFLDRKQITLQDAIAKEKEERGGMLEGSQLEGLDNITFSELGNGESLVLE